MSSHGQEASLACSHLEYRIYIGSRFSLLKLLNPTFLDKSYIEAQVFKLGQHSLFFIFESLTFTHCQITVLRLVSVVGRPVLC